MSRYAIQRLKPDHGEAIVACFNRVYGGTYANDIFHSPQQMREAMQSNLLRCVGTFDQDGQIIAHMAMTTVNEDSIYPELGNTVVDPVARGAGLAWKVGAELTSWCRELGYTGFLHYPTAAHHIMQQQSVKQGFETGVMLGYIPGSTHAGIGETSMLRDAATIVFEPIAQPQSELEVYLPSYWGDLIKGFARHAGLPRTWKPPQDKPPTTPSISQTTSFEKRSLHRLTVTQCGDDFAEHLSAFTNLAGPVHQLDLLMSDSSIDYAVTHARNAGFIFCGWLPGFSHTDVLRLQKLQMSQTNLQPALVNATAQTLLETCLAELGDVNE